MERELCSKTNDNTDSHGFFSFFLIPQARIWPLTTISSRNDTTTGKPLYKVLLEALILTIVEAFDHYYDGHFVADAKIRRYHIESCARAIWD